MKDQELVNAITGKTGDSGYRDMVPQVDSSDFPTQWMPSALEGSIIDAQAKEIEKLRGQVPRWIPVEERLPEVWRNDATAELVNYMIYSPDFGVDIGNYHAKAKKWLCMALPCTVTHWMPLPEPPEVMKDE